MRITNGLRQGLQWWEQQWGQRNSITLNISEHARLVTHAPFETGASFSGFGARLGFDVMAGVWPGLGQKLWVNELELAAVALAVGTFGEKLRGCKVLVKCDNTATVGAINSGTSRSRVMMVALRRLASLCLSKGIALRAVHLPGVRAGAGRRSRDSAGIAFIRAGSAGSV